MKQQYTKKQITEAIAHWQSVLKKIDESKSILFDAFADKFGNMLKLEQKNIVYDSDCMTVEKPSNEDVYLVHIY